MSERVWRWIRRGFLPGSTMLLILAGSIVPLPAYIEQPGTATSIPPCVSIERHADASVNGDIMFTTVLQRDATVFGLLLAGVAGDRDVVPRRQLIGDVRRDLYLEQQREVFVDSTERAVAVALDAAGLPVRMRGSGAHIIDVVPGSPAAAGLQAGDVVTAVDGRPIETDADLIAAVDGLEPLRLEVRRGDDTVSVTVQPRLGTVDGRTRPLIGVRITTDSPRLELPLDVDVTSGRVGGPSAGLMIALAVYDLVADADLAAGRRIAGTGTLALDGRVGPIDRIELKVPAAIRRGADVFLAPAEQEAAARAAVPASSNLAVIGVGTFDDALAALERTAPAARSVARTAPAECEF